MKATVIIFLFMLCIFSFIYSYDQAAAEEFLIKGQYLLEGEIIEETDTTIVIQTENGPQSFAQAEVEKTVAFVRAGSTEVLTARPQRSIVTTITQAIAGGFQKILTSIKPTHFKFIKWLEGTKVHRVIMQVDELKKFKRNNYAGYIMSVYCIALIVLAIVIRIMKEIGILILSFFGVKFNRSRY